MTDVSVVARLEEAAGAAGANVSLLITPRGVVVGGESHSGGRVAALRRCVSYQDIATGAINPILPAIEAVNRERRRVIEGAPQ